MTSSSATKNTVLDEASVSTLMNTADVQPITVVVVDNSIDVRNLCHKMPFTFEYELHVLGMRDPVVEFRFAPPERCRESEASALVSL